MFGDVIRRYTISTISQENPVASNFIASSFTILSQCNFQYCISGIKMILCTTSKFLIKLNEETVYY